VLCVSHTVLLLLFRHHCNVLCRYLAGNKLSGPLPGIWGSSEALGYLGYLDLSNNTISGTLPSSWGQNGSFPRLTEL
jgi:hypothetical protein